MKHPDEMGPPKELWMLLTEDGPEYFDTEDEARESAAEAIEDYRDPVDGWDDESVSKVIVARVVAYAGPVNVVERPLDQDLDEDGCDEDGNHWEDGQADICDYELLDVDTADLKGRKRSH